MNISYIFHSPKTKNIDKSHFNEFNPLKFIETQRGKRKGGTSLEETLEAVFKDRER